MKSITSNKRTHSSMLEVQMEIVLGSPSRNCEGIGICKMLRPDQMLWRHIPCPHATGYLGYDILQNRITIRFRKNDLPRQMVARHFYKRLFKVTESYKVPACFIRTLGLEQKLMIQEGVYEVMETSEDWIIDFGSRRTP